MTRRLTRRDVIGTPSDWVVSAIVILGPPCLMLWSMHTYPFLDWNNLILAIPFATSFICGSILTAIKREAWFPWADAFPAMARAGVPLIGLVTAMAFGGAFITLNGLLDWHHPATREYVVTGRSRYNNDYTLDVAPPDSRAFRSWQISVSKGEYEQSDWGMRITIDIKPGVFGIPWVAGHRVLN